MAKRRGRKLYGYYADEQAVIEVIRLKKRRRRDGSTPGLRQIARELNDEGYRTQLGKKWAAQTVKNVLSQVGGKVKKKKSVRKQNLQSTDYLTKNQLKAVVMTACARGMLDETIIAVLVGAGLRAAELCALEVRDLGIFGGKSQIDIRRGKGAKARSIYIAEQLVKKLKIYLRYNRPGWKGRDAVFVNSKGGRLKYSALYKRIKTIGKKAGIDYLHPHALRHTFATLLYNNKKDVFFVKEQLGHSSLDTTQIYAKTLTKSKLEQIESFGDELGGLFSAENSKENTCKREIESLNSCNCGV